MIANFFETTSFEKFPKEIQTQIFQKLVGKNSNIFFTKKAYGSYDKVVNLEERIAQDLKQLITKGYLHKINSSYYLFAEDGSPQYS